jgi:hypothetical protein
MKNEMTRKEKREAYGYTEEEMRWVAGGDLARAEVAALAKANEEAEAYWTRKAEKAGRAK